MTADDQVVFTQNGPETSDAGAIHLIGGGVEETHVDAEGLVHPDWCMAAELQEEVGLRLHQAPVEAYKLRWLITEALFQSRFPIYSIHLDLTAAELLAHFDRFTAELRRHHDSPELQELIAMPRSQPAVEAFLSRDQRPRAAYLETLLRALVRS